MAQLVRFDWAIKYLLRDKANFDVLEGFLSAVLGEDIYVQELLESEGNQEDVDDKFNRVDLLVRNDKDQLLLIEVQIETEQDFFHRLAYGTAKLIVQYIDKGKPYSDIKKVISVSITYFNLGEGEDYAYYGSTTFVGIHKQDTLKLNNRQKKLFGFNEVHKIFPEYYLLRVGKFDDNVQDDLDEWVYMLKNDDVKPEFEAKNIQVAREKLHYMSLDAKKRQSYDHYAEDLSYRASMEQTVLDEVKREGIEQGIEKGKQAEKIAIAQNGLKEGLSIRQIAAITGLSADEITQLRDQA